MESVKVLSVMWILMSITIIVLVISREPNVESPGVIIQDSLYREEEPGRLIDTILTTLVGSFIAVTLALLL